MIGTSDLNILFTSGLILILRPVLFCKIIKRFDPLPPLVFFKYIGCLYKIVSPPPFDRTFLWTAATEKCSIFEVFVQLSLWMPQTDRFSLTFCMSIIRAKSLL